MCRSAREGGQRCHAHALAKFQRATSDYRAALATMPQERTDADRERLEGLYNDLRDARAEYASTPKGERELVAQALSLEANGRTDAAADLRESVRRGLELRARNVVVGISAEDNSANASLAHLADMRAREDDYVTTSLGHRTTTTILRRELTERYKGFRAMAERDSSLHAPRGWAARNRHLTAATEQNKVRSRAGQYALWRATTNTEDHAPALPDGVTYQRQVTPWRDLRPGDFVTGPGYRHPGDVVHEGKVVEHVDRHGGNATVRFTDGSTDTRTTSTFTVLRPVTPESEARLRHYTRILGGSGSISGRDEHGAWAEPLSGGERVYAP